MLKPNEQIIKPKTLIESPVMIAEINRSLSVGERVNPNEFLDPNSDPGDLYSQESINSHNAKVLAVKKRFAQDDSRELSRMADFSNLLEKTITRSLDRFLWMGDTFEFYQTSEFDDIYNGIDIVGYDVTGDGGHVGFDLTYSPSYGIIRDKINNIKEKIFNDIQTEVIYFDDYMNDKKGLSLQLLVVGCECASAEENVNNFFRMEKADDAEKKDYFKKMISQSFVADILLECVWVQLVGYLNWITSLRERKRLIPVRVEEQIKKLKLVFSKVREERKQQRLRNGTYEELQSLLANDAVYRQIRNLSNR